MTRLLFLHALAAIVVSTAIAEKPSEIQIPNHADYAFEGEEYRIYPSSTLGGQRKPSWKLVRTPPNGTIDKATGVISIPAQHLNVDPGSPTQVFDIEVQSWDEQANPDGSMEAHYRRKSWTIELIFDIKLARYRAEAPSTATPQRRAEINENLRKINFNVFLLGGGGITFANLYDWPLLNIATGIQGRPTAAYNADPTGGRLLHPVQRPAVIEQILLDLASELSDATHPLYGKKLMDYYTSDLSTGSDQDRRDTVFGLLDRLAHQGVEIPFLGLVDRTVASWLFNPALSKFLSSDGIGDLVEHHYYTKPKNGNASRAWYICVAKQAGVLKYWRPTSGHSPNYGLCGPAPSGTQFPGATAEGMKALAYKYLSSHDTSKANDKCCCSNVQCCDNPDTFCSIFEGECSLSSDPCVGSCGC